MPVVVPVKFPYASKDLWFDPEGLDIVEGDYAICYTERGTEIGLVTSDPFEVPVEELGAPLKSVIRIADDIDLDKADELAERGEEAMHDFRRLVKQGNLEMKPVGVEFLFGGERAVFYFSAEARVDFRQLVRDLSSCFHTRIDMHQIGVRDETRLIGGYATCGQELCCARFSGQFEPVSIRMAKEQDLPLNSAKISGMCGRLMCCLRYEFEAYKDFKSRAPKKKTLIDTPLGKARIMEYSTPREQLVLRLESGRVFRVNLSDMTCSEGCKKRAAEQGCSCRPDCVTRDIMEKIDSPEIKLALLELDRKNGVDVGDGLDRSDRIVASGPTPRRKAMRDQAAAEFAEGGSGKGGSGSGRRGKGAAKDSGARPGQGAGRRGREAGAADAGAEPAEGKRRRRRPSAAAEAQGEQQSQGRQRRAPRERFAAGAPDGEGQGRGRQDQPSSRRRRRHLSGEDLNDAFRSAAGKEAARGEVPASGAPRPDDDPSEASRSRRRHRSAEASQRPARKPDVPSVAEQVSSGKVKVTRRRPGDGGGNRSAMGRADGEGIDGAAPAADGKSRRRRRSRKPRSDEGGPAEGAAE